MVPLMNDSSLIIDEKIEQLAIVFILLLYISLNIRSRFKIEPELASAFMRAFFSIPID